MTKSPDAFRTISEVAEWLDTPAHVLRFWESKFSQVKPVKRAGGRRYYRPADMELLGGIKKLLHDDGMTIKGVQKILSESGIKAVAAHSAPVELGDVTAGAQAGDELSEPVPMPEEIEAAPVLDNTADAPLLEDAEPEPSRVVPFAAEAPAGPDRTLHSTDSETEREASVAETAEPMTSGPTDHDTDVSEGDALDLIPDAGEVGPLDHAEAREDALGHLPDTHSVDDGQAATETPRLSLRHEPLSEPCAEVMDEAPMVEDVPFEDHVAPATEHALSPKAAGPVPDFLATPLDVRLSRTDEDGPTRVGDASGHDRLPDDALSPPEPEWQNAADATPSETLEPEVDAAPRADILGSSPATTEDVEPKPLQTAEAPDAADPSQETDATMPAAPQSLVADSELPEGTLMHVARLARLTPAQAARIAPLAAELRALLSR